MKLLWRVRLKCFVLAVAGLAGQFSMQAAVRYVDLNSPSPAPPYTNWATAARVIQHAVDAAIAGDEVVVTNGTYDTGGRAVYGAMTNRVAVDKPLTLRSVNGPEVTTIQGYQVPGATNGDGAIRCVYLTNAASLSGFTLSNGATFGSGSDYYREQSGGGLWSESTDVVVSNCIVAGNSAYYGGGAVGGTLFNCTLSGNSAYYGGGAYQATLNNCTLSGNSAILGGGADGGTLNNCTLSGNSATYGGGASGGTLLNCIVYYNIARQNGNQNGDNYSGAIFNYSCTTPLPPEGEGNISAEPLLASVSHLSVGSPCRGAGSAAHATGVDLDGEAWANPPSIGCDELQPGAVTGPLSVAIVASYTNVATGFEVNFTAQTSGRTSLSRWEFDDGTGVTNRPYIAHGWVGPGDYPVVLWAYNESYPGGVSATVIVHVVEQVHYVAAASGNPVAPYSSWATAAMNIQDAVDATSVVGALVLVSNGVYQTGGRVVDGAMMNRIAVTKPLTVRSVNGPGVTVIAGYQVPRTNGDTAVRCVYLGEGAALVGFTLTNGATRSSGYYESERSGGGVWCASASAVVSNCVLSGNSASYSGGGAYNGTLNKCTLTGNTAVEGGGASYGTTLNNCTLTGNLADSGGGAWGCRLNNCTLNSNRATYSGGGAYGCGLKNCTLIGNSATGNSATGQFGGGGGASESTLNNCTLTGNSATNSGGGVVTCTLNNCILYYNTAPREANYSYVSLNYSCAPTLPTNGIGNITNAPRFMDANAGDFRLQSNSPCINSGRNAYAPGDSDFDGNPRIVGGTVDVGAYELQSPQSAISYAWLQQYGLPIDPSTDSGDPDGDRLNNWQEWRCLTDPTNALSVLRLLSASSTSTNVTVCWQSMAGVSYFVERSTNLGVPPALFTPLATGILGQASTTSYTDTTATGSSPFFYRVGVGN